MSGGEYDLKDLRAKKEDQRNIAMLCESELCADSCVPHVRLNGTCLSTKPAICSTADAEDTEQKRSHEEETLRAAAVGPVSECPVCLEWTPLRQMSECCHAFCDACISQGVDAAIVSASLPVACLQCDALLDRQLVVELLREKPLRLAAFEQAELNLCLKRDPLVRFCVGPDCPNAFICDVERARCPRLVCPHCRAEGCFLCRQPWHAQRSCQLEGSDTTKPCPGCGVTIYKGRQEGCNAMKCTLCNTDFCWLCLGKIDSLNGLSHFTSLNGCTLFGARAWSWRKQRAVQLTMPVTMPVMAAGAAMVGAAMIVSVPVFVGVEEWGRGGSTAARVARTTAAVTGSIVFVPPMIGLGVAALTVRLAYLAYVQMPFRESKKLLGKALRRKERGESRAITRSDSRAAAVPQSKGERP